MNKLIAKLDFKDYCNNRTTLKIHLLEDGQLSYGLASTKGIKNDSRLPDHIQDIEGFLKDHILDCIRDSVKEYLPDSYVTYHELDQENDWDFEESIVNILGELKEYQKVNPQRNLQSAIKHLEQLINKSVKMLDTAKSLEDELWAEVESLGWAKDHDYRRIREEIEYKFTVSEITRLTDFVDNMINKLMRKYYNDWLGDPGIDVSDDGWSDLTAEVVGRGKDFYENITLEKLQEMANNDDYRENFRYCFHN